MSMDYFLAVHIYRNFLTTHGGVLENLTQESVAAERLKLPVKSRLDSFHIGDAAIEVQEHYTRPPRLSLQRHDVRPAQAQGRRHEFDSRRDLVEDLGG